MNAKSDKKTNILYTGKGDKGTTTLFHCNQGRISKSANIIEALGAADELNAYLGIVKVQSEQSDLDNDKQISFPQIIDQIQNSLFIIQAEIAGSKMMIDIKEIEKLEEIIKIISESLPPINSFTVSGGSLISALLDYSRTLARRCERRVISVVDGGNGVISENTMTYLNRLSSVLFALSRYSNYLLKIPFESPKYLKK